MAPVEEKQSSEEGSKKENSKDPAADEAKENGEEEEEERPGIILPSGEINWDCPCLGGVAQGPCGEQFKAAFSCFHYSESDPKGSECYDQFKTMHECMQQYPEIYSRYNDDDDDEDEEDEDDDVDEVDKLLENFSLDDVKLDENDRRSSQAECDARSESANRFANRK